MGLTRHPRSTRGFSLPFILIAAMILLIGGLMLVMRSSDGLLSILMQGESSDARDAAETGLTRILAELNRPRNRGLLVSPGSTRDAEGYLWTGADAAASRNPCLPRARDSSSAAGQDPEAPDLTGNASIGFSATVPRTYNEVLLNADGQVVSDRQQAVKAYRLLSVRRWPLLSSDDQPSLRIFEAEGRGSVVLIVEGSALRNGRTISRVRLEEELQLVPKCCDVSFGGAHGDSAYAPDSQGRSLCLSAGWGFVAGMAQNGSGAMTINGVTTIADTSGQIVNPLFCFATSTQDCQFNPTSTDYSLRLVQPTLRAVRSNPVIEATTMGSIGRDSAPQPYPSATSPQPFLHCSIPGVTPGSLRQCPQNKVTINAAVADDEALLPRNEANQIYCRVGNYPAQDEPEAASALHCNIAQLDYSQLSIEVTGTATRALRLYFPQTGDVIRSTGGGSLEHRSLAAHFALFGCSGCTSQAVRLSGSAAGLNLFAWFPRGDVTVAGASGYQGVLWANTITSSGGVTWAIPPAAVLGALELAGFGLEGERNPPAFDWVARSVRSFRWLGL